MKSRLIRATHCDASPDLVARVLPWLYDASRPYLDYLVGSPDRAREMLSELALRDSSEFSVCQMRIAEEDGELVGGYISMPSGDLPARRKADATWIAMRLSSSERRALLGRMAQVRMAFAPARPEHLYLSRIGVLAHHRGRGVGRELIDDLVEFARDGGYRGIRLDVWSGNQLACRLYEHHGFRRSHEPEGVHRDLSYVAMELDGP